MVYNVIYTIISLSLSVLANSRSQFLLDRIGRCLKLFVSTESISCHEFASQFGLAFFLLTKNTQNYREYRITRGRSIASDNLGVYMSGDHIGPSGVRVNQNGKYNKSKRRQREIIPSRLEQINVV